MPPRGFRIQADLIVVAASIPSAMNRLYAPGQIELHEGRVVEVTRDVSARADVCLEGYALLPGLVNPHTHLEFSDLAAPLPPGTSFPEWIGSVLATRRARGPQSESALAQSIAAGLQESRAVGVAALADIVTPPWSPACLSRDIASAPDWERLPADLQNQLPLDAWQQLQQHAPSARTLPAVIACLEQLGLSAERTGPVLAWRDRVLGCPLGARPERLLALALSPHAPYSTQDSLWRENCRIAAQKQWLVAMHIAESQAERQWLDSGTGPFSELYAKLGVHVPGPAPDLVRELLHELAQAPRGLLIHGNYLTSAEIEALSRYRRSISVVYCPRTHQHFGHVPYPLDEFRSRGIRVVLGTDSRSSNPDLNLWQEARTALSKHKSLRPSAALAAISDQAAEAIGLADRFGSLQVGHIAAVNAVPLARPPNLSDLEEIIAAWFENVPHPITLA